MTKTSFSIVITCYNHRAFIQEAVQSALSQSCPAKEVVVVDDASVDGTVNLLKQYGDAITLVALQENSGGSTARNAGASVAKGDYLVFLDGDDVLLPWALELYSTIVAAKQPTIILSALLYFKGASLDGSSVYFRSSTPLENYGARPNGIAVVDYESAMKRDRGFRATASAIVAKRKAFEAVDGWSDEIFPAEDYDLLLKLGNCGRTIQIDAPAPICCRMHEGNTMRRTSWCASMLCNVVERAHSGFYGNFGGQRFDSYAILGGPVLFWLRKALRGRCYKIALNLLLRGWPMMLAAALRRLNVAITGKRPIEVLPGLCGDSRNGGDANAGAVM